MLPSESGPDNGERTGRPRGPSRVWWLVFGMAASWLLIGWLLSPAPVGAELTYSDFLAQVEAGNVTAVTIEGDDISGEFAEPTPYPPVPEVTDETPTFDEFTAVFPESVGDPELLPLLQARGVDVDVVSTDTPIFVSLLINALPFILIIGLFVWLSRRTTRGQAEVFGFGRSRARRRAPDMPDVTFADVAGQVQAKAELEQVVGFLREPGRFRAIGARLPRGVLLVGPPGTGKTLLGRAVAGEAGVPFYHLSATEFVEMFVGVGASRVRDLFDKAKAEAPSIIFIDELDAVGRRRGAGVGTVNDEREQTLNQLLYEMDGFEERHNVVVLAATNRPDVLDPALLRPGRFDREVVVDLPDRADRLAILRLHTASKPLHADVDLEEIAAMTMGMSGADLANITNEAALIAAGRAGVKISAVDFDTAMDKVMLGGARKLPVEEQDRRAVAYHEAGHAITAWFTEDTDPVRKVTIIPHGRALGATAQLPEQDRVNYTRGYLIARLSVLLAGRVAEELTIGDVTTGAESDLLQATRLARRMVTRWGMGTLGPIAFRTDDEQPFLGYELAQPREVSPDTATRIDEDVERLIEDAYESARTLLASHRDGLERVVDALMVEETLDDDRLEDLLGPPARTAPSGDPDQLEPPSPIQPVGVQG